MGLFDFNKNKKKSAEPTAPVPAAATPAGGPRYQGAKFTSPPAEAAPVPAPMETPPAFQPENVLEQLLLLASTDENARPAFYQALLQEPVLMILAPAPHFAPGEVVLGEGQEIQLQLLGDGKLPIFTSVARLSDGGVDNGPVSYVPVPGHAFFSMTQGQDVVLNPFSPAGKLLPAAEIAALLAGQLTAGTAPADGDTQAMLAQPDPYPTALSEAIAAWCATQPQLQAAYLARMTLAHSPEVPRLLLAFESADPNPEFMQQLGPVLQSQPTNYQFVDLMLLDKTSDEGVNPYFRQVEPFWRRG